MKLDERSTNLWVKEKLRADYRLDFREDVAGISYQRGWVEEEPKLVVLTNATARQRQLLSAFQARLDVERSSQP